MKIQDWHCQGLTPSSAQIGVAPARQTPLDPMPRPRKAIPGEEGELVVHPKGLGPPLDGLLRGPPRHLTTRLVHRVMPPLA
jgi:hypothetical protein